MTGCRCGVHSSVFKVGAMRSYLCCLTVRSWGDEHIDSSASNCVTVPQLGGRVACYIVHAADNLRLSCLVIQVLARLAQW